MAHLANIGEPFGRLIEMAGFKAEIYGEMSEEFSNAAQGLDVKVYSFFNGFK